MLRTALAVLVGFFGLTFAACGGSGASGAGGGNSGGSASNGSGGSGGGGSITIACDGQPAKLALDGTWAAYGELAVTLKGKPGGAITICPAGQVGASTMMLLLAIKSDPNDATKIASAQATLCSIALPTVTALVGQCPANPTDLVTAQILAPPKLIAALPNVAANSVMGMLGGSAPGASISLDRFTVTVGTTQGGSSMPSWNTNSNACSDPTLGHQTVCETTCVSDCSAMRDDDKDGYPGVTVDVCGYTSSDLSNNVACNHDAPDTPGATIQGRAFVDIQVDPQFSGNAVSSCELRGTVDTQVLYNLVGADVWLDGASLPVSTAIDSLPSFEVNAANSKFRMIRVDGKYGAPDWNASPSDVTAACASLNMHANDF